MGGRRWWARRSARKLTRDLVRQAITDIQGSIEANDQKSAAGLVAQALLATAVVTLVVHLGSTYQDGTAFCKWLIKIALGGTLVCGVTSISCLIVAVSPYEPALNRRNDLYFPDLQRLEAEATELGISMFELLKRKFSSLDSPDGVDDEYLWELLKVADIRYYEAEWGKWGFRFLLAEVAFTVLYLATIGAVAGNVLGAAVPSPAASLRWEVVQNGHRQSLATIDGFVLSYPKAQVQLRVEDPAGERSAKLTRAVTYRCSRKGRTRVLRPVTQNARLLGARHALLVATAATPGLRCPRRIRPRGVIWRFRAEVRSQSGALTVGLLRLRMAR
jgi:hypothetical protein